MLQELLLVIGLSSLATLSPGADFAVVARNAMQFNKQTGYMTAVGVASATWVHTLYCITGLALIISKSPFIFNFIKYLGATYLLYLGLKSLLTSVHLSQKMGEGAIRHPLTALKEGFLSNATNPKTTLFYLSLFSMVISPTTSIILQILYGFIIFLLHLLWFSFVCYLLHHPTIHHKLEKFEGYLTKIIGIALIFIAIRIFIAPLH